MDDKQAGLGIIGLGGFGLFLIEQWSRMPDVRIVAASDRDLARAALLPEGVQFYAEDSELLADADVTVVSIATPPASHLDIALRAIAAGKHVLVEKPLALSAEQAKRIGLAAADARVVATVNFMLRYDPLVEALRSVVQEEIFGKLRRIDLRNYATQDTVPEGHWFWDPAASGGILIEHGVHFFDMAAWLTGACAAEVTGLSVERQPGMEDRVFASVVYDSGVVGTFWHSFTRPMALEITTFHMAFDLGDIEVEGWVPLAASYRGWVDESGQERLTQLLPDPSPKIEEFHPKDVRSSEFTYRVSRSVRGRHELPKPKMQVYGDCVRSILKDLLLAVDDPMHSLRVTADDGVRAVETAERATLFAQALKKADKVDLRVGPREYI